MNNLELIIAFVLIALCLLGVIICIIIIKINNQEDKIDELQRKELWYKTKIQSIDKRLDNEGKPRNLRSIITSEGLKVIDNDTNDVVIEWS